MKYILCVYYSRTGHTEALMKEIAQAVGAELVKLDDGINRKGPIGWLRSGMQAMARHIPPVKKPRTQRPLRDYGLVILGTPVWAGRCSSPMRSFLLEYGPELRQVAYVITRASENRYEEVFDQMDLYITRPRTQTVSICPQNVGSQFWKEEFLAGLPLDEEDRYAR